MHLHVKVLNAVTAVSASMFISHFAEAKCEMNTVDWCVYYTLCHNIRLVTASYISICLCSVGKTTVLLYFSLILILLETFQEIRSNWTLSFSTCTSNHGANDYSSYRPHITNVYLTPN